MYSIYKNTTFICKLYLETSHLKEVLFKKIIKKVEEYHPPTTKENSHGFHS
jgi:hypothetical protein